MAVKNAQVHGSAFTTLHGVLRHGSDPSRGEIGNPAKHIQTVTSQVVEFGLERGYNALLTGSPTPQTASFLVASNVFTERAEILLGEYTLVSNIDYLVAGTTALTAAAISAAIDRLPGYTATPNGSTVDITREPPLAQVDFRVLHHGAVENFTTLVPAEGLMNPGAPVVGPPLLT